MTPARSAGLPLLALQTEVLQGSGPRSFSVRPSDTQQEGQDLDRSTRARPEICLQSIDSIPEGRISLCFVPID